MQLHNLISIAEPIVADLMLYSNRSENYHPPAREVLEI